MKIDSKIYEGKKRMGLEVHQDDIKQGQFPKVIECNRLRKVEGNINLMVQLKSNLKTTMYHILKNEDGNLSLMNL
jgi:hypothetical protein